MAALSENDLRRILGADYRPGDEVGADGEQSPQQREKNWRADKDKYGNHAFSAGSTMVVGAVLVMSNVLAFSGPSVPAVNFVGAGLIALGAAWLFKARRKLAMLESQDPAAHQNSDSGAATLPSQ